jgi:hypothetical protein
MDDRFSRNRSGGIFSGDAPRRGPRPRHCTTVLRGCISKEAEPRDYLLRMQAEGVVLKFLRSGKSIREQLDIVVGGPTENMVFESATGGIH